MLGLAGSGKSTLFSLLTGHQATAGGRRDAAQVGIARVPDTRLDALSALFKPRKTTPANVRYVEIPGVPETHRDEAALNFPELRTADALLIVVRAFVDEAVPHPLGRVDPARDLLHIEEELILQDQLVIDRRLQRLERDLAKRSTPDLLREQGLLQRCLEICESSTALRDTSWSDDELRILRGFTFLSLKPVLVVVNVGEDELTDSDDGSRWASWRTRPQVAFTRVCATLESELAELDGNDAEAFMTDLGIAESALHRVIRESYRLLGLISFFTVGDDECRAWSIRSDTPAVAAGGVIHSDISRGFIRAEVVPQDELLAAGSLAACRQRGTLRLEGKDYLVQDGEVVHFRFNV
jgi:hypothetical protein